MVYNWPKGRVIRTILLVILVGIGIDFGIHGWQILDVWNTDRSSTSTLVTGSIYGVLAVAALIAALVGTLFHAKAGQFLIEVEKEMTRVTWPTRPEVIRSTIIIAVLTVILAAAIFLVDTILIYIVHDQVLSVS